MLDLLNQLYKTKLQLLAVLSTVVGIALLLIAHAARLNPNFTWLIGLPITDIGSALFT